MFAAVYSWRAMGPAVLDPEVGIDFSRLVHGAQEFTWHEPVVAGDEITTEAAFVEQAKRGDINGLHVQLALGQPARRTRLRGDMDELREVTVTPDRYLTYRYAGASGDFNPIHLDDEFARSVELPAQILHGLWTMAQVARVQGEAVGDPLALKSLSRAVPRHGRAGEGHHDHLEAQVLGRRRGGLRLRGGPGRQQARPPRHARFLESEGC